jgi:hypothetical protein
VRLARWARIVSGLRPRAFAENTSLFHVEPAQVAHEKHAFHLLRPKFPKFQHMCSCLCSPSPKPAEFGRLAGHMGKRNFLRIFPNRQMLELTWRKTPNVYWTERWDNYIASA